MTDDTRTARPAGTLWLVIVLASGALLITGYASWVMAAAFAIAVFRYISVRGRDAADTPRPTGTFWFVITLMIGALLVSGRFDRPWIGAVALAGSVLLYIRALSRAVSANRAADEQEQG